MWNVTIQTPDGPLHMEYSKEEYPTKLELELTLRIIHGPAVKFTISEVKELKVFVPGKTAKSRYSDIDGNPIPTSKYYHHDFADPDAPGSVEDDDLFFEEMYQ